KLKVSEIKEKLDELSVEYDAKLKKSELLELLKQTIG
ncbi:HeH/LEM domain-containing protein, partial [Streptococcus dysgalactiae]